MATKKSNNSKLPPAHNFKLSESVKKELKAAIDPCIEQGKASVKAETDIRRKLDHGTPETHAALTSLYGFGQRFLKLTEKERSAWIAMQVHVVKGEEKAVPYYTPAKENCFIALTKIAFPNCEEGTRSRYATILFAASNAAVSPQDFPEWLVGPHKRGEQETGTGVKGAYEAYKKVRAPNSNEGSGDKPDWAKIAKAVLRDSAAVERPSGLEVAPRYKGGFCLALCHIREDDPSMSFKFVHVDETFVEAALLIAADNAGKRVGDEAAETPAPIISLHNPAPETAAEEMA
jgi:hypothetical protein